MAEEHRCEASEGHRLCVNNCGFFGSPATMNLCAKCYTAIHLEEQHHASSKSSIEIALSSSSSSAAASSSSSSSNSLTESLPPHPPPALSLPEVQLQLPPPADVSVKADVAAVAVTVTVTAAAAKSQPNRCLMCRKRVGLTGFKCRCGTTFCGVHRYPEKHACTFDFKAVGREEIARANPVIKAEKLRKI